MRASCSPEANPSSLTLDAAVIAFASLAICLFAHNLLVMSVLIPALFVLRVVLYARLVRLRDAPLLPELLFLALCTLLGAFNDWNSVVRHGIYDYTVPVYFPALSTIPLWMLLYWGLILRFLASVTATPLLGAPESPRNDVRLGVATVSSPVLKVALELVLVVVTRQAIYRCYADPVLSWLPLLVALLAYLLLFGLDRHRSLLVLIVLVGGPAIEVLYIQVASLHVYQLGWIGGVPLWIVLWWVLAILVWQDISFRLQRVLARLGGRAVDRTSIPV